MILTLLFVSAPTTAGAMNPVRVPNVLDIPISVPTIIYILSISQINLIKLTLEDNKQERPAVADKPARRLRNDCTVYVRAVGSGVPRGCGGCGPHRVTPLGG